MKKQQLEIGFADLAGHRLAKGPQRRVCRARWWFGQMRRVVDEAMERKSVTILPADQMPLPLAQKW